MHNLHTPILTAADLRAALAAVPDERRVVVMRDGVVVPCELVARKCGDWLVLDIIEPSTERPPVGAGAARH